MIGEDCIVGRGAYVGAGVGVGDRVKIQNHALVYEPAVLEDGVFIGPAAVLTNDSYPRAVNVDGTLKSAPDWAPVGRARPRGRLRRRPRRVRRPRHRRPLGARRGRRHRRVATSRTSPSSSARRRDNVAGSGARDTPWSTRTRALYVCPVTGREYDEVDGLLHERDES